jgi:hypothetical protein
MRPTCINHNCGKLAAHDGKRWRVHCGHCQGASYGKHPHAPGVVPYKKGICANQDGHLGFPCAIDYKTATWAKGMTEVDHKDGDRENHDYTNLDELCSMCHKRKGQLAGDYNNQKNNNNTRVTKGKIYVNGQKYFDDLFEFDEIFDVKEK